MRRYWKITTGLILVLILSMSLTVTTGYCKTYDWTLDLPMNKHQPKAEESIKNIIKEGEANVPSQPLVVPYKSNRLKLTWKPVKDASTYKVYEKTPGASFKLVGETDSCQYISKALKANTLYYYRVSAVINGHEGKKSNWVSSVTKASKKNNASITAYREGYGILETGRKGVYIAALNVMKKNYDTVCWNSLPLGVKLVGKNLASNKIRIINDNPEVIRLGIVTKGKYENNSCYREAFDRTNGVCILDVLSKVYGSHKVGDVVSLRFMAHNGKMVTIKYLLVIDKVEGGIKGNIYEYNIDPAKYAFEDYKEDPDVIVRKSYFK